MEPQLSLGLFRSMSVNDVLLTTEQKKLKERRKSGKKCTITRWQLRKWRDCRNCGRICENSLTTVKHFCQRFVLGAREKSEEKTIKKEKVTLGVRFYLKSSFFTSLRRFSYPLHLESRPPVCTNQLSNSCKSTIDCYLFSGWGVAFKTSSGRKNHRQEPAPEPFMKKEKSHNWMRRNGTTGEDKRLQRTTKFFHQIIYSCWVFLQD